MGRDLHQSTVQGAPSRARRRARERGRLLVEVVVASGIGAVALLGLASLLPLALRLRNLSEERGLARRAAEQRLTELASMDDATFRRALASGPSATALAFDVPGLVATSGVPHVGAVQVTPAPGSPGFDSATLFQLTADCRWTGSSGPSALRLAVLAHPSSPEGGP